MFRFETMAQNKKGSEMPIEQIAFDYFVSKMDSILISDGGKAFVFDTVKNKIYFSGETSKGGAFNPSMLNRYKKDFIILDSLNDYEAVYSISGKRSLYSTKKFVVIKGNHPLEYKDCVQDISLQISMRCFKNNYYYVRIGIGIGIDWISNDVYIKLDKNGDPIGYLQIWGIE